MAKISIAKTTFLSVTGLIMAAVFGTFFVFAAKGTCSSDSFRAEYYANADLGGEPVVTRCEARIDTDWGFSAPVAALETGLVEAAAGPSLELKEDGFSVRWSGRFEFSGRDYLLTAGADDGIRIWIDDHLVIDAWQDSPYREETVTVQLTPGSHVVRVDYYEKVGMARALVKWQPAG